jgi:hypothetical protein
MSDLGRVWHVLNKICPPGQHEHAKMGCHQQERNHESTTADSNAFTAKKVKAEKLSPRQQAAVTLQRELTMYIDRGNFNDNRHQAVELRQALIVLGEVLHNPEDIDMWGKLYRQLDKCAQMLKGDKSFEAIFEMAGNIEVD